MKKKLSIALTFALCLSCVSFSMAQDATQQKTEKVKMQTGHYAEAVDPDPDLTTLPGGEQEKIHYKELPDEQEKTAIIPGTSGAHVDNVSSTIAPEGEPDVAVQPPQARTTI